MPAAGYFEMAWAGSLCGMDAPRDPGALARYWDGPGSEKRFSHPLRREWLQRYTGPQARILDLGCGYGRTLGELGRAGYKNRIGMDISRGMLRRCRSEQSGSDLVQSDGRTIPLREHAVDLVVLFAVLTSTPRDQDQIALLGEIGRVLRPGGHLYISDLLLNNDARNLERYERYRAEFGRYGTFRLPDGIVVRHHEEEWIQELTGGFHQLEYEVFEVATMNGNRSAAFQFFGRASGVPSK